MPEDLAREINLPNRLVSVLRKRSNCNAPAIVGLAVALTLLLGCAQPVKTGSGSSAPVAAPDSAALTGSPQIGPPAAGDATSVSGSGVVGEGSFPRSFLIPGTNTSVRIGG
jgi:hypothetical protein